MKIIASKERSFSFCCPIILLLFLKPQREYVGAQVRECDDNRFGYECRFQCRCQQNEICNVKNGICTSGCADGFWGSNCQLSSECYYNGHREKYEGTKSVTLASEVCRKWKNYPHNYCRPYLNYPNPWCYFINNRWNYCSLNDCGCPPGLYGINCIKECHCKNATEVCDPNSGYCSRCGPGWKGINCNQECQSGNFGENCQRECHCVEISQCRQTDGKCLYGGCVAGYAGENCQKECDNGMFGRGCQQKCHCADNSKCQKTDGKCLDDVCATGYIGHHCQTSCPVGKFGEKCQEVCQCSNPSLCNNTDGRCADNKCKFGYRGQNCQQRNLALIVLLVLIPILLLIGIISGVVVYLKKRKPKRTFDSEELKSGDNVSMSQIEQLNLAYDEHDTENIYQNTALLAKNNILSYIEKNKMEEEPFASEFSRLPQGLVYAHGTGILDENTKKNRYKTLIPYDHSRVVLLPDEMSNSDYINASYITEEKKYIATQGPITGTFNDFWRMVWQEKCHTIIMLTDIIENGKLKCAQYWPDLNHTETYGKIKIHCVQEKKFMIYTYRLLSISKSSNLVQEECFIDHFQCTTWPDHDVPEDPIYFIEFRNTIRHRKSSKPPYVVHCSAGVGRTGTYIALDILLERLWKNLCLDVFQCVNDLRQQRPLMVHRRRQYQFIYEVLAEDVLTGFSEIATEFIPTEFRRMLSKEVDAKVPLQEQYEIFLLPMNQPSQSLYDRKESMYKNVAKINDGENPYDDILFTTVLDGFTMMNEIILTTQPSETLTEDFWKFIYKKRCTAIIMFEDLFNAVAAYWPNDKNCPQDYGGITVELMGLTERETFFQRQFKVSSSEENCTLRDVLVNHFQAKIWFNKPPPSHIEIIEFIQIVSGYIKPQRQILVHCQDGFSKSGLFSLLYVMVQMMKTDSYISILRLVRRMKKKNGNIIRDFKSYEYCWMVANVFLGELSIYSNF